jgi:hypothetical protein
VWATGGSCGEQRCPECTARPAFGVDGGSKRRPRRASSPASGYYAAYEGATEGWSVAVEERDEGLLAIPTHPVWHGGPKRASQLPAGAGQLAGIRLRCSLCTHEPQTVPHATANTRHWQQSEGAFPHSPASSYGAGFREGEYVLQLPATPHAGDRVGLDGGSARAPSRPWGSERSHSPASSSAWQHHHLLACQLSSCSARAALGTWLTAFVHRLREFPPGTTSPRLATWARRGLRGTSVQKSRKRSIRHSATEFCRYSGHLAAEAGRSDLWRGTTRASDSGATQGVHSLCQDGDICPRSDDLH